LADLLVFETNIIRIIVFRVLLIFPILMPIQFTISCLQVSLIYFIAYSIIIWIFSRFLFAIRYIIIHCLVSIRDFCFTISSTFTISFAYQFLFNWFTTSCRFFSKLIVLEQFVSWILYYIYFYFYFLHFQLFINLSIIIATISNRLLFCSFK
jgi:hypothetical protein